jgi:hypothetical protein
MKDPNETYQDGIEPKKYTAESRFRFACHKGKECYTHCCSDLNIILTPYDIIRMKNKLNLTCDQFLAIYTKPELLSRTRLPVPTLKMLDDVQPTGEDFYLMVRESHCLGFEADKEWTVGQWRENQGIEPYDEINHSWMELMLRKKSFGFQADLSEESRSMFFMVSTNVDKLERFIFESSLLKKYDVEKDVIEKIKTDEVARLKFGFDWLQSALFGADRIRLKDSVAKAYKEKAKKEAKETAKAAR